MKHETPFNMPSVHGGRYELLWERPIAELVDYSEEFTIEFNSKPYPILCVILGYSYGGGAIEYTDTYFLINDTKLAVDDYMISANFSVKFSNVIHRTIKVLENGLLFGETYVLDTPCESSICIPNRIYGIR